MNWLSEAVGRKFAAFLAFLIVSYIGAQLPAEARDTFLGIALKALGIYVGGQTVTDAAKSLKNGG